MAVRILDEQLVNTIAAGEVVERPASVVKELVENALDAGATELRVHLRAGGRNLVRVVDNGAGMDRTDALMCLERHATSKIRSAADLFAIATLGFRGEAIPSVAAVSKFEIRTRPAAADVGTRVRVEGGKLLEVEPAGCAPGTEMSAASLFFNVPARRKFLRSVETELGHCVEAVTREALIRPDLDLEVLHDERELLRVPAGSGPGARAAALLGAHGEALVPIAFRRGSLEVEALLSPVGVHRANAQGSSYLYVNGRFVKDLVLRRAVSQAYAGIVPKDRYPVVILQVRVPAADVDVNVHPAKTEVRFQHAFELQDAVASGLRNGLQEHGIRRPVLAEARYRAPEPPAPVQATLGLAVAASPGFARERDAGDVGEADVRRAAPSAAGPSWGPREPAADRAGPAVRPDGEGSRPAAPMGAAPAPLPPVGAVAPTPLPPTSASPSPPPAAAVGALLPVPRFRDLRVLGQLARTYVLCEGGGALVIVDQHAAHERITLYRLMRRSREALGGEQRLLTPVMVQLAPARARLLGTATELLAGYGLDVAPMGGGTFAVHGVPAPLRGADLDRLLADVADDLAEGGRGAGPEAVIEHVLATMACHTSVRAGRALDHREMEALLRELDEVDFSVCAHGRPVVVRIDAGELERRFHRA